MPMSVEELWALMKSDAAASAASSRLGGMSLEHMLPETSMVRMMVVWLVGTATTICGRPIARTSEPSEARNSTKGLWRRKRPLEGRAARISDRLE
jgi:hypothetical protein